MTEQEWLQCTDSIQMLQQLRSFTSERKFRLFACGSCRCVGDAPTESRYETALAIAEHFADGNATDYEMRNASRTLEFAEGTIESAVFIATHYRFDIPSHLIRYRLLDIDRFIGDDPRIHEIIANNMRFPPEAAAVAVRNILLARPAADETLTALLRCTFGNPFRPVTLDPRWLSSTVIDLARTIYEERVWERMPILADALMDAGCDSDEIINHCRGPGPHVRGCFVVDLLTGRE
jgi:hypothetical protein